MLNPYIFVSIHLESDLSVALEMRFLLKIPDIPFISYRHRDCVIIPMTQAQFELDLSMFTGTTRVESDRMALLRSIHLKGTLTEAAKEVGISYKTACSWLDALNNAASEPLLITTHGGNTRGGTVLSELGLALLAQYERVLTLHSKMQDELAVAGELNGFLQRLRLRTSARNHLHGTIAHIRGGHIQSIVTIQFHTDLYIQAKVSHEAIKEMGLSLGTRCAAVFKAASAFISSPHDSMQADQINTWTGKVLREHGDLESVEVTLNLDEQHTITALVDRERWDEIHAISPNKATISVNPSHVILIRME